MGAEVEEREDGLKIPGSQTLHGAELDSFDDHRIAMAFAVAALRAQGETPFVAPSPPLFRIRLLRHARRTNRTLKAAMKGTAIRVHHLQ